MICLQTNLPVSIVFISYIPLDPSIIYNDKMDGFMMQFAAQGLWGRGKLIIQYYLLASPTFKLYII